MLQRFKINTAALICIAFLFRLLFVNVGIISSLSTQQTGSAVKSQFSTVLKKKRQSEVDNSTAGNYQFSAIEICEEGSDEDNSSKSNPFLLIHAFFAVVLGNINASLENTRPFYSSLSYTPSHRYLTFRVFRI